MERRSRIWSEHRLALFVVVLLAVLGVVLALDGSWRGEARHRIVAATLGFCCMAPLATTLVWPERALRLWKRLALSLATLVVLLAGVEVAIRVFDLRAFSVPEVEEHARLGHVQAPNHRGIDGWGFRNALVPEACDIVCIGDSQTYGTNIPADATWSSALARVSGRTTYNMSVGGYGPLQYRELVGRALELAPGTIVVGLYLGNDLFDAHRFAGLDAWAALRNPALEYPAQEDVVTWDGPSANLALALVDGVLERSRLLGSLVHDVKLRLKQSRYLESIYWQEDQPHSYQEGALRTLFTPDFRQQAMDLDDPAIEDGLRITEICLAAMQAECAAQEVELVLLLIHTKELYYQRFLGARGAPEARSLEALERSERRLTEELQTIAQGMGLRVVDPTLDVLAALNEGRALWPQGADGHINRDGSRLFAEALWRELRVESRSDR